MTLAVRFILFFCQSRRRRRPSGQGADNVLSWRDQPVQWRGEDVTWR